MNGSCRHDVETLFPVRDSVHCNHYKVVGLIFYLYMEGGDPCIFSIAHTLLVTLVLSGDLRL